MANVLDDIEATETLLTLVVLGVGAYLVYRLFQSVAASPGGAGVKAVGDAIYNAATGALDCSQKEALAQDEARAIVKASNETISFAEAIKQARADVLAGVQVNDNNISIFGTSSFGCCFFSGPDYVPGGTGA